MDDATLVRAFSRVFLQGKPDAAGSELLGQLLNPGSYVPTAAPPPQAHYGHSRCCSGAGWDSQSGWPPSAYGMPASASAASCHGHPAWGGPAPPGWGADRFDAHAQYPHMWAQQHPWYSPPQQQPPPPPPLPRARPQPHEPRPRPSKPSVRACATTPATSAAKATPAKAPVKALSQAPGPIAAVTPALTPAAAVGRRNAATPSAQQHVASPPRQVARLASRPIQKDTSPPLAPPPVVPTPTAKTRPVASKPAITAPRSPVAALPPAKASSPSAPTAASPPSVLGPSLAPSKGATVRVVDGSSSCERGLVSRVDEDGDVYVKLNDGTREVFAPSQLRVVEAEAAEEAGTGAGVATAASVAGPATAATPVPPQTGPPPREVGTPPPRAPPPLAPLAAPLAAPAARPPSDSDSLRSMVGMGVSDGEAAAAAAAGPAAVAASPGALGEDSRRADACVCEDGIPVGAAVTIPVGEVSHTMEAAAAVLALAAGLAEAVDTVAQGGRGSGEADRSGGEGGESGGSGGEGGGGDFHGCGDSGFVSCGDECDYESELEGGEGGDSPRTSVWAEGGAAMRAALLLTPSAGAFAETGRLAALGVGALHVEYAERGKEYGILFMFSLFCEYFHLEYVRIHVIYRVNQTEYVIHILVVAPQEYVNIYSIRRALTHTTPRSGTDHEPRR